MYLNGGPLVLATHSTKKACDIVVALPNEEKDGEFGFFITIHVKMRNVQVMS